MAFRTNKVPAIEERTVSGSSVSFNSAFALPLKACKVSFTGTQEGSGTTSPTNKRPLTYKSNVSLSDNGSTNIISLGGRKFYKFDLDVLNGILEPTMEIVTIDENSDVRLGGSFYIKSDATDFFVPFPQIYPQSSIGTHEASYALCDTLAHSSATIWITEGYPNRYGVNMAQFHCNIANDLLGITDYTQETVATALVKIKAWLADNPITCAIPINETIQLSPAELSSILGNNTFSTDTGTLEITFADLQEKSASGAVASFNTALAMPLSSCNIAVNAWQEGSGDPSPSNVRPIHGFSEVNAYQRAVNLWDEEWELGSINNTTGQPEPSNARIRSKNYIPIAPNTQYYMTVTAGYQYAYDINKTYIGTFRISNNPTPSNCYFIKFRMSNDYGTAYNHDISINYPSTDTDYHAYTGNTYTIQLGQEVYGAEVDVVNGVLTIDTKLLTFDYTSNWTYNAAANGSFYVSGGSTIKGGQYASNSKLKCNILPPSLYNFVSLNSCFVSSTKNIYLACGQMLNIDNATDFKTYLQTNSLTVQFVVDLATPFDIQLTPTQIETIRGNNTIFADTGDISLTYKDLDIAKRGNFREVFKLPS